SSHSEPFRARCEVGNACSQVHRAMITFPRSRTEGPACRRVLPEGDGAGFSQRSRPGPVPPAAYGHRRSEVSMRGSLRPFATCVAGIVLLESAQAGPPELVTSVEAITEYRLDNALRILLFPDPSKPRVTVNLTLFVGSRHEGYGEAGMAHLLEHMLFKGTPTFPEVPKVRKEHGAD